MNEWKMWSLRMPDILQDALKSTSRQTEFTMSEIVRQGTWDRIEELGKCEPEILEAAKIAIRERKVRLSLMKPKSRHRAMMQPIQAWNSIEVEREEYKKLGLITPEVFDSWITMLEENKASIEDDNPEYKLICDTFDTLILKLREQRRDKSLED